MPIHVTLLGHPACTETVALRRALCDAAVPHVTRPADSAGPELLGQCGYTLPALIVTGGYGGPAIWVRPRPDRLRERLERLGLPARRRAGRQPAMPETAAA